jgi:WD40 repeat protein
VLDVAELSGDYKQVRVATSVDNAVHIWDGASHKEIAVLNAPSVNGAAFSGDGKQVVTTSDDRTARIWDARNGRQIAALKGHTGAVTAMAFSSDGKRVLTGSSDYTARIWDADSGGEIAVLKGVPPRPVSRVQFSHDDTRAVTGAYSMAHIWEVAWTTHVRGDTLRERVCAEKLIGAAQEFTDSEMQDPILRGIDVSDPIARNPCLRRGPLSLVYWTRLPAQLWRSTRRHVGVK